MTGRNASSDAEGFLPLPPANLQLLMVLAQGPLHAYGISKAVPEGGSEVPLPIGSLYRMLWRMEERGLIEECAPPEGADEADEAEARRRYYGITALGREVMLAEMARLRSVLASAEKRGLIPDGGPP